MNCADAQEQTLERLAENEGYVPGGELAVHLASCQACRMFAEEQHRLDAELSILLEVPPLDQRSHASITARVAREPRHGWPDFLPDIAHWAGGGCATALLTAALPLPAGQVVLAGAAFTLATYFLATLLRDVVETWEESKVSS